METTLQISDIKQEGIRLARWTGPEPDQEAQLIAQANATGAESVTRAAGPGASDSVSDTAVLDEALAAGRLLPEEPRGAFAAPPAIPPPGHTGLRPAKPSSNPCQ